MATSEYACVADGQCTPFYITHRYNIASSSMLQILQEAHGPDPRSSCSMASIYVIYMQQGAGYHHCHTAVAKPQRHCC